MLRLAGLIAFLILAVVLLVVLVRGCASDSKHARYRDYITRRAAVAAPLRSDRQAAEPDPDRDRGKGVASSSRRSTGSPHSSSSVATGTAINPPGPLRVEHDHLIEMLQLRASGLSRLADAFRQTATAKNATTAGPAAHATRCGC